MTTLSPEEAEPAPAPGSAPPAQPSPDPTSVPAVCSVCQQPFPSRNALFRHLRETCLPQLPAAGAREGRAQQLVALLCGYVGHQFHGSYRTAREDEDARPTVEGAVVRAVEAAWGTSVCSITQAVRTERKASAARNVIVVGLNPAVRPEAAALREALPPSVTLLAAPLPMALKMGDLTRVRDCLGPGACARARRCPCPRPPLVHGGGGGGRARSLCATPPSPPPPRVLRDSGVGAMAPKAPRYFSACFPFIKPSMF